MKRELCRYCRKPMANDEDCDAYQPGEGEHLCWQILQNCDQDPEEGIDLRDKEIARLERELQQERQLADRLKNALEDIAFGTIVRRRAGGCGQSLICTPEQLQNHAAESLADWRKSGNE